MAFDIRKDHWMCTTPIDDDELKMLIFTHLTEVGLDTKEIIDLSKDTPEHLMPHIIHWGIVDCANLTWKGSGSLKKITLKELMTYVEEIRLKKG